MSFDSTSWRTRVGREAHRDVRKGTDMSDSRRILAFLSRRVGVGGVCLAAMLVALAFASAPAGAGVTHVYEKTPSEELAKGVLAGCSGKPAGPACLSGPLSVPNAIAASGGGVWAADATGGGTRVDRFNAETGVFTGPQLDEEPVAGATGLGGALAVGHAFLGGEQVYAQTSAGAVAVFDGLSGALLGVWSGAHAPGGFGGGKALAVDGSENPGDVAKGFLYVANQGSGRSVDVFNPEQEVAKAGEEPPAPVTVIEGTCTTPEELPCSGSSLVHFGFPLGVAVSPVSGDVVVLDFLEETATVALDEFEPVAGPDHYRFVRAITEANHQPLVTFSSRGLAVDGNGDIFLGAEPGVVDQFSATGEYLTQLTGTPAGAFGEVGSVGVDPVSGRVFVGESSGLPVAAFGESVTIPDVELSEPSESHATLVTLNGTVKLDEAGSAECFFEYGTSSSYGTTVPCEPATVTEEPGGEPFPVKATITGLQPDTTYFYRLRAVNGVHIPSEEDHGQLTTEGPGLDGDSSSEVASTAATLDATIDPHGSNISYYFQYSETNTEGCAETTASSSSCLAIPAPPGEPLGSAPGEQNVFQRLQGLSPGRTYHYRVVVLSEPKAGETEVFTEADHAFTTQPAGSGFTLPDGRQWELVTPPDKHGATPFPIVGTATQASLSGDAFTFLATNPTEEHAAGYHFEQQLLATRGATGWTSSDINPPNAAPAGPGRHPDYQLFSEDLSLGLEDPQGEFTSLKPDVFPLDTANTPYLRHDLTCQATPATCYEPLVTGTPGYADVPVGTKFGGVVNGGEHDAVSFAGASPDLSHVVVNSEAPLKKGGTSGELYEWSADRPLGESELQPVSVLPAAEGGGMVGADLGTETKSGTSPADQGNARWAISGDGTRVVWTDTGLYLSDMTDEKSVRLDVPEASCLKTGECGGGAVAPMFQIANEEGSRVFFSDSQQLVAGAGPGDLYECEVVVQAAGPKCVLHDLAPGAAVVGAVLGASEDGSYVYFVSNSVVGDAGAHAATPGNCPANGVTPTAGESCNLYMVHYNGAARVWEAPVFIGTLSGLDSPDWSPEMIHQSARVSPNGRWLTFTSVRPLTGYNNHDARSGQPDEEVFLFDAAHGRLVCASCNPTGARPVGYEQGNQPRLANTDGTWPNTSWLAASLPEWTSSDIEMSRYQSRYLDDEGRLFFDAHDALVPQDVNGSEDVYEFEPAGVGGEGGCTESASGFHQAIGGCVSLLSSGTSADESVFLDASESGNDVFFLTSERLVKQDTDTAFDVYNAHVCSSASPCFSAPESSVPCTTADACRAASPPQPEVFGAPASATFSGSGNLAPVVAAKITKKKTVKCKKNFAKNRKGECVRKKSRKRAKKSSKSNRGGQS